jgi:hypothetical protein
MSKAVHATITSCASCHPWAPVPTYDINTVAGLIQAMGGYSAVARDFGITIDEPRRWEILGYIPPGWHLRIYAKMLQAGRTLAPAVFDYPSTTDGWQALARASRLYAEGCAHG